MINLVRFLVSSSSSLVPLLLAVGVSYVRIVCVYVAAVVPLVLRFPHERNQSQKKKKKTDRQTKSWCALYRDRQQLGVRS